MKDMTERQLIEDLLSALEYHTEQTRPIQFSKVAIAAAREYLRKPAQQKPVALPCCGYEDASAVKWNPYNQVVQCHNCGQVYTTPQAQPAREWVGLTDEELIAAIYALEGFAFGLDDGNVSDGVVLRYARIVEAKLKERNA